MNEPPQPRAGPSTSVETLVRNYRTAVFAVCLAHSRDLHEAEDRVQDVFLKALQKIESLGDATKARAWLYQIARRVCADGARRPKRVGPLPPDLPQRAPVPDPRLEPLLTALARMPSDLRETLALYYLDARSCANVAACLGTSPAAVRQRLVRGRLRLHELLTEELP